jgi:hypothetical protein
MMDFSREVCLSDSENNLKRELECLRLASELTQMAAKTHHPDLKARFLRMARHWTDQTDHGTTGNVPMPIVTYH